MSAGPRQVLRGIEAKLWHPRSQSNYQKAKKMFICFIITFFVTTEAPPGTWRLEQPLRSPVVRPALGVFYLTQMSLLDTIYQYCLSLPLSFGAILFVN